MNTKQIFRILAKKCKPTFIGVFARNRLPKHLPVHHRPIMFVYNTDPAHKVGQHWIAMYFDRNGTAEYFYSFGMPPSTYPIFEKYLNTHSTSWTYNNKQLQSIVSKFCGHYVVMYCLFKNLNFSMNSIINCFTDDTGLNDTIANSVVSV